MTIRSEISGTHRTIRTPDQRLRVFVSSTLGELADERTAARAAIEQMRLAPVMFELGARPHAPRALYRAYLEQSDVFVGIYWQRYGWTAPDMEISGLEDEFRLSGGMPRLFYLKEPAPDREAGLRRIVDELEAEGSTASYKLFHNGEELRDLIADDLALLLTERFTVADDATGHAATGSIPQPVTPLVGRDADVKAITDQLVTQGRRLVTLTGVGGIGKTRLALAVLNATAGVWGDGEVFVDLSSVRDPSLVLDNVASSCGIRLETNERAIDGLARRLAERRMLIALDNFEQVVDAAPDVADLLQRCPSLTMLVTSRTVLHVRGEREIPIAPLEVAAPGATLTSIERTPSVDLFVQRAQDVRSSFELTPENAGDISEICRRLDGVPLALELAAARTRLLSPKHVLDRLHERLGAADAFADLPERQRTLTATLDWSYGLLGAAARTLLARLSVFAGPLTLDAAAAVCDWRDLDIVEELSTLVDHSLVGVAERPDGEPGFRLLETVRAYAGRKLEEAGEVDAVYERLERYLLNVLEAAGPRLGSPEQLNAIRQLDGDVENIFAVIGWAIGSGRPPIELLRAMSVPTWLFFLVRGAFRRVPPDLAEVIRQSPGAEDISDEAWSYVYSTQSSGLFSSARYEDVVALLPAQIPVLERAGQRTWAALMNLVLAAARPYERGGPARHEFERALELLGDDDEMNRGYVLVHFGSLLLNDGDVAGAQAMQRESLRIGETIGDANLIAESHMQLAHDAVHAGDIDDARRHVCLAAEHYQGVDHLEGKGFTLGSLAGMAVHTGEPALAAKLLGAAEALREPINLRPWPLIGETERRYAERARAQLPQGAFDEAFEAGRAMSADDAIELGLGVVAHRSAAGQLGQ